MTKWKLYFIGLPAHLALAALAVGCLIVSLTPSITPMIRILALIAMLAFAGIDLLAVRIHLRALKKLLEKQQN